MGRSGRPTALRDCSCCDADSGKDLATELRETFIPDFSHWKEHEQFEAAFARLLKDLKTENSEPACLGKTDCIHPGSALNRVLVVPHRAVIFSRLMFGQFQFQSQESRYVVRLGEQIARMDREVEDGRTLTLELREGDQTLTLSVHRERVEPVAPHEMRPQTGMAASLERNETMVAMMTGCYSFDLAEVNREVAPAYIERKLRSPGRKMAVAAADERIPNPAIRWIRGNNWSLTEDCSYRADGGFTITAKTGFETDLASIPRFFWVLLSFHDLGIAPPTFHDLIYRAGGTVALPTGEVVPADRIFTREEADDLFLELMTLTNIRWWKRRAAYLAVHHFGESSWRTH